MLDSTSQPSALKVCSKCEKSKPLAEYVQRKSGRQAGRYEARCKVCMAQLTAAYRAQDPAKARAAHRLWLEANREHTREYARQWKEAHPEHGKNYMNQRYRIDGEFRERARAKSKLRRATNPEAARANDAKRRQSRNFSSDQERARTAINRAVRRGVFPPAWSMVCESCEEAVAAEYHHHKGYSTEYKLDVIALCTECHGKTRRVIP